MSPTAAQGLPYSPLLSALRYLDIIAQAVSEGQTLLIEDIGETIEAVLDPLLGRTAKGRSAHPTAQGFHLPQAATAAPECWQMPLLRGQLGSLILLLLWPHPPVFSSVSHGGHLY